jgi:hypothetical protein
MERYAQIRYAAREIRDLMNIWAMTEITWARYNDLVSRIFRDVSRQILPTASRNLTADKFGYYYGGDIAVLLARGVTVATITKIIADSIQHRTDWKKRGNH